jgi:hypothetical protein
MLLVGPAELHDHCPELTLTMAAVERTLFSYMEGAQLSRGMLFEYPCHCRACHLPA